MALRLLHRCMVVLRAYWPQLLALYLIGFIAERLLLEVSARLGLLNHLAGLSSLTWVVLLKLVIILAMFQTLMPGLPALAQARSQVAAPATTQTRWTAHFAEQVSMTLLPFFALYAAWGFLSTTLRDYALRAMQVAPIGSNAQMFEIAGGAWLLLPVVIAWAVRRTAKQKHKQSTRHIWPALVVICEANWAFIGLYVMTGWHDSFMDWLAHLPETLNSIWSTSAQAATSIVPPAESETPVSVVSDLKALFFYGLYPLVWLTLAAVAYGYDISRNTATEHARLQALVQRLQALPKALREFIAHFVAGTVKRYQAIASGVGLTLHSGASLILLVAVIWRLLDWGAAWGWYGATHIVGPLDAGPSQLFADALQLLLGPAATPGTGLLIIPIKMALLAAALDTGFATGRKWLTPATVTASAAMKS